MDENKEIDKIVKHSARNGSLDVERTKLSIERTFLSYIRTSLTVLVAGVSLIQFFDRNAFRFIGFALVPLAVILFIAGLVRIKRKNHRIEDLMRDDDDD